MNNHAKKDLQFYRTLFISSLKISALTFGGGAVIVSMMKKEFCDKLHWISEDDMLDYTAVAQSTPGAVAVNAAMIMGFRLAGPAGAFVAALGTLLPPLVLLTVLSYVYTFVISNPIIKNILFGMSAGVCAVIFDAVRGLVSVVLKKKTALSAVMMLFAFAAVFVFKINVVFVILVAAILGIMFFRETENDKKADEQEDKQVS